MFRYRKTFYLFLGVIIVIFFLGCAFPMLNRSHSTPRRPYKFPVFTMADSLRGTLNKYRSCYDVHFYNLNVDFDFKQKAIKGYVDFYFQALEKIDTFQIDLYNNMILDSIVFEKRQLAFYRKYNAVFILTGNPFHKSQNVKISVYYHGRPKIANKPPWEGGFVWSKDDKGNPWIAVACEVDGASLWWPVKDHLSDEPDSMKLNFTIPSGLSCISNGKMTDSIVNNGMTTFRWKVTYPINTYCATFYIGNFVHFSYPFKGTDTTFNLDYYVLPYNLEIAREHFKQAADMLHFYESVYGPYPWPRDGYKLVESPYEGMENQTAIAYGNGYKNIINLFDQIILHESAHEWWGNSVTVPDYAEVWIHEGFATYSEALYVEHTYGHQFYVRYLSVYAMLIRNKKAVIGPHNVNFWDYKDGDVYMKGALMLHTLRNTLNNDSLFFDILKSFYNAHKYGFAVTQDFINLVNSKTKSDYNWFFKQYLYNRESPELVWNFSRNEEKNTNELSYRFINVEPHFSIPLKIKTGDGDTTIYPSRRLQKLTISSDIIYNLNKEESYIELKRTSDL